jgi:putative flavoprotein involved in K+ transport
VAWNCAGFALSVLSLSTDEHVQARPPGHHTSVRQLGGAVACLTRGRAPRTVALMEPAIVIGAGPAGLASAAMLQARGVGALVVERASDVGSTWRAHYARLRLHTERRLSSLPGLELPREYGKWVPRAQVVEYLESYARHHQIQVKHGVTVERVEREGDAWRVKTSQGNLSARVVVVATGFNHTPGLPSWSGHFAGELLHSSTYKTAAPYRGRDVLVVGTGNSGAEIAVDLVEGAASRVRVAVRTPPNILRREVAGISSQRLGLSMKFLPEKLRDPVAKAVQRFSIGDLTAHGLPPSPRGPYTRAREGQIPILDVGFVDALKRGLLSVVPAVTGFDGHDVLLEGGGRIRPDAVIAATGYSRALEKLVGHLGVLSPQGLPTAHGPDAPAPRLHFIGYSNPVSGNLREIAIDARKLARAVARELA